MARIGEGIFSMGSKEHELPVHVVRISGFYMDSTDVTQGEFKELMGFNPSCFTGDSMRPVEMVTWFDAVLYCNARSRADGFDTVYSYTSKKIAGDKSCSDLGGVEIDFMKHGYRLPTEAEWEYACRAGSTTEYYWGGSYPPRTADDTAAIDANAWWHHNSANTTHPVAHKKPNAWGLYDMSGNVWQWCNDWYDSWYDSASPGNRSDPTGPSTGRYRVLRGGSWYSAGRIYILRSAYREYADPEGGYRRDGFRCVRR
jgi:formylglycine-generating enzyme required for sulfatase activity